MIEKQKFVSNPKQPFGGSTHQIQNAEPTAPSNTLEPTLPKGTSAVLAGLPPLRANHPLQKDGIKRLHHLCSVLKRRSPLFDSWRRTLREILESKLFLGVAGDFEGFCRLLDLPVEGHRFAADPHNYNWRRGTGSGTISSSAPESCDGGPSTAPSANKVIAGDKRPTSTQTPDRIGESLKHQIEAMRAEEAAAEAVASAQEDERKLEPLKTYLVKYGIRTPDFCYYRNDFSTGLVQAANLYAAYDAALKFHVSEAFDEDDEEVRGQWVKVQSKSGLQLGFELGDDYPDVDARCLLWIEKLVEVEPSDVAVVERYLADW
jgi:hypothetical protein